MNLPPTLRKLAGRDVTFSRALLKDRNLLSKPQPEAVLAPVSYRSSRRRRQRKRLLLKVPTYNTGTTLSLMLVTNTPFSYLTNKKKSSFTIYVLFYVIFSIPEDRREKTTRFMNLWYTEMYNSMVIGDKRKL